MDAPLRGPLLVVLIVAAVVIAMALFLWAYGLISRVTGSATPNRQLRIPLADATSATGGETLWQRLDVGIQRRRHRARVVTWVAAVSAATALAILARFFSRGVAPVVIETLAFAASCLLLGTGLSMYEHWTNAPQRVELVPPGTLPAVESAMADMAIASGVSAPCLYVAGVDSANAFLLPPGCLCLTRGLLTLLTPEEFRGVFAWMLSRASELEVAGSNIGPSPQEAEVTDAAALRLLGEPGTMLRAWNKVLASDNEVPGTSLLPAENFLVPPESSPEWCDRRLQLLGRLMGAMAVDSASPPGN